MCMMFFASDRELAEEAYAGDVIGIPNHGVLRVGDSLSETGLLRFAGLPNFAPEILQRVRVKDPLKAKHLKKALEGLAEEGVTQLFRPQFGADFIVGAGPTAELIGVRQVERLEASGNSSVKLPTRMDTSPGTEKEISRRRIHRREEVMDLGTFSIRLAVRPSSLPTIL